MQQPFHHERLRRGLKAKLLIEVLLRELRFDFDCIEVFEETFGGINGSLENYLPVSFAALSGDDSSDAYVSQLRSRRAYTANGYGLAVLRDPKMNGSLVVVVNVLVNTVLLNDKDR